MAHLFIDNGFWVEHGHPVPGSSSAVRGSTWQGRSRGANGSAIIFESLWRGLQCGALLCGALRGPAGIGTP